MPLRPAFALLTLTCLGACASAPAPLSARAAAMPVFAAQAAHPPVGGSMGTLTAYACVSSTAESSAEGQAQDDLRRRAEAKGADALVGYSVKILAANPRAQQCARVLEAAAEAVALNAPPAQASIAHSKPS